MELAHQGFPFEFVLMLGDNIYGDNDPSGFRQKFEEPYQALLKGDIKFYASLGTTTIQSSGYMSRSTWMGKGFIRSKKATRSSLPWIART